ncbi:Bestrophin-3 [Echinococcus granulosus]|uniref:Bestrophin homolog n=1 Tax=Echinococcus granulosus TaxID=6210 RepID=W6UTB4_ECHGR|nr:Bestrophin-3 [Echinococcus granulosus]EUB63931.1 Bestrophin-3 [Echinococcus granulosus]
MSIPYSWKIATNSPTAFLRLLIRWKGTIYRYILFDFCVFLLIYGITSLTYRYLMSEGSRRIFEHYCLYCARNGRLIPVGLVLGFYVDVVVKRWWEQLCLIPWPDEMTMLLSAYVLDDSEMARQKMKTLLRYINLSYILTFRLISSRVQKRYPVDQSLLADGIVTPAELKQLYNSTPNSRGPWYATPIFWACQVILELRATGLILSDRGEELLFKKIQALRSKLAQLLIYDMVNIPLGFTQFLDVKQNYAHRLVDLYIPVFGILQLIFFLGWLKVAEALINPFGEDTDDFAIDEYIKRNLQITNFLIEKLHDEAPLPCNGVIFSKKGTTEEKMGKGENRNTSPSAFMSNQHLFSKGVNLFIRSCANTAVDGNSNGSDRNVQTHRTVSSARKLNSVTVGESFLPQYIDGLLDSLCGSKLSSTFELKSAFYQLAILLTDKEDMLR